LDPGRESARDLNQQMPRRDRTFHSRG